MSLEENRGRRDFASTPEPAGTHWPSEPRAPGRRFVVQRHRATRLHYDFRLEVDGVLVSWAVPRGPTLDAAARRMAVHVEDHPLEYVDFEGVIPAGQYGGGDVIVWDWGTWEPEPETPDPIPAIEHGELKFVLHGEKLRGRFTIVRTSRRPGVAPPAASAEAAHEQWLLIHKRDANAAAGWDAEDHPRSVKSGRTNDEVRAHAPAIWVSDAPLAEAQIDLSAAVEEPMPNFIEPMRLTLASRAFRDEDWLFEVKWDGYRVEAVVRDGQVRLFTRNGNDAQAYFPQLLSPPSWIDARAAIVDGEVVALDARGRPDFGLLQERITEYRAGRPVGLVFQAFDLLHLDGRSLLAVPLEDRKRLLRLVLREGPRVRYAGHVTADGLAFLDAAERQGLEGIVAKMRRSRYVPGQRGATWLKVKLRPEQELVVGGWTAATDNPSDLGALAVGVYEGSRLRFAGKVGSGFTDRARQALLTRLDSLRVADSPFDPPPPLGRGRWGGDLAGVVWVRPDVVIRAELGGWSRDGMVRQASFKGLELGRDPLEVVRERAVDPGVAEQAAVGGPRSEQAAAGVRTSEQAADGVPPSEQAAAGHPSARGPSAVGRRGSGEGQPWEATHEELRALDALAGEGRWRVGGQTLHLTNLDKALFPPRPGTNDAPVTKGELISYFARIAPAMLPHLVDRPLNLHRFPNGTDRPGFWQKNIPASAPKWLTRWHETGLGEDRDRAPNDHLVADGVATLAWLANQAAFEIHAWTSTTTNPWMPTFALIDIDPGPRTAWEETLAIARLYRTALDHLGVRGYPKTTGSRGLQIWIPIIRGKYDYRATSAWVERLSRTVAAALPDLVSWEWSKQERGGKARLDYTQNAAIKTLVAPYAVRPRPGAPVSMPIAWDELDDPSIRSDRWTIRDAIPRVTQRGDLFAGAQTDAQDLPPL
ncbi:MAG: non-homologous end-joining DNA ligase [Candidatus Nanopelagicales bacterium]